MDYTHAITLVKRFPHLAAFEYPLDVLPEAIQVIHFQVAFHSPYIGSHIQDMEGQMVLEQDHITGKDTNYPKIEQVRKKAPVLRILKDGIMRLRYFALYISLHDKSLDLNYKKRCEDQRRKHLIHYHPKMIVYIPA